VLALSHGLLSVVSVLAALYPAGTVLLARYVLGERLTGVQRTGLAVAGVAAVLIAA
jgi:drug/metabolite transporter (DMT)-like permease